MSRSRNIKPGFFKNEVLVQLPFEYRLLFIGLWTVADRAGRFEDRPTKIEMELFPADAVDVDAGLQALHDNGFILRYSCNGAKYCQVIAWAKHQNPHCKEVESIIPAPCSHGANTMRTPELPERAGLIPDPGFPIPDSLIPSTPPLLEKSFVHSQEKSYSQTDFDARDLRKLAEAREKLELKLSNGWGSNLSSEKIWEHQCILAGMSVQQAEEVLERTKKRPQAQTQGASA